MVTRAPETGVSKTRLFLDVDGVINLYDRPDGDDTVRVQVFVPSRFEGQPPREYTVRFSPEIVRALGVLIVDLGLELVFLSTWNEGNAIQLLADKVGLVTPFRVLPPPLPRMSGYPRRWKVQALVRDLRKSPSDFVWVDDEIGAQRKEAAKAFPVQSLIIQPDSKMGLTAEHLADIRQFAGSVGRASV